MRTRNSIAVLGAAIVASTTLLGVGTASAEPQLPSWSGIGNTFGTFGDHSYCRGAVRTGFTAPKGKRGVLRVTFTSLGFTGNNPGWSRNPACRLILTARVTSGNQFNMDHNIPATFGPRRGQKVTRDIVTGSGLIVVGVLSHSRNVPALPQSYGSGFYVLVP